MSCLGHQMTWLKWTRNCFNVGVDYGAHLWLQICRYLIIMSATSCTNLLPPPPSLCNANQAGCQLATCAICCNLNKLQLWQLGDHWRRARINRKEHVYSSPPFPPLFSLIVFTLHSFAIRLRFKLIDRKMTTKCGNTKWKPRMKQNPKYLWLPTPLPHLLLPPLLYLFAITKHFYLI